MAPMPLTDFDENAQVKLPDLPKGNWTSTPQALAQLYINGHEQMHQVHYKLSLDLLLIFFIE